MRSQIFLKNIVSLDFCYATPKNLTGLSLLVDVVIEGDVNANGMVIDFAHVKKLIKSVTSSFDHKVVAKKEELLYEGQDTLVFEKAFNHHETFIMESPKETFCTLEDSLSSQFQNKAELKKLEQFLNAKVFLALKEKNPLITSIQLTLRKAPSYTSFYMHSLPFHEGYCQRFHGHSTKVAILENKKLHKPLSKKAQNFLKGFFFISKHYEKPLSSKEAKDFIKRLETLKGAPLPFLKESVFISYEGHEGQVRFLIPKRFVYLLDTESTAEMIHRELMNSLDLNKKYEVFLYEGYFKGAQSGHLSCQ
jgi:6-pyruvoyl-tetrahydropterin synthase